MNKGPEDFLKDFLILVRTSAPGKVAQWLFANTGNMGEAMFFDPDVDWAGFDPHHILALRVCAPGNVFTATAKCAFLSRVSRQPELFELADALFGNDMDLIEKLPAGNGNPKSELIQLMQLAYRRNIRPSDPRIKKM